MRSSEKDFVIKRDEVSADQLKRSLREIRILVQGIKKRLEQKMYISKANDVSSAIETYEMSFDVFKKSLEEQQKEEKKMHDIFAKLSDKIKQMNTDLLATLKDVIKKATMLMVVLGIGAVILGIFIALFITKVMNNSIQHSINQLLKTEEIIRRSSDLLSTKSTDLQSMSQQQHEMINYNFNLLKKMNEVIHENLQRADISKKKADDMMSQTMSGSKAMSELNTSMERIKSSNDEIQKMVDVMHMIKQKTDAIESIVFKTNLLSFNASIEAARAGTHGKGFSVVATEVGNLATSSGSVAMEISEIVDDSAKDVEMMTQASNQTVQDGLVKAGDSDQIFQNLSESANTINRDVTEIYQSSKGQAKDIDEITSSMKQLEDFTLKSVNIANETASFGKNLNQEVSELDAITTRLKSIVYGARRSKKS